MNQDFGNGVRPKLGAPGNRNSEQSQRAPAVSEPGTLPGPCHDPAELDERRRRLGLIHFGRGNPSANPN